MTKKSQIPEILVATTELRNDKKKKSYKIGDEIKQGDFPKSVITVWMKQGILIPADGVTRSQEPQVKSTSPDDEGTEVKSTSPDDEGTEVKNG